MEEERESNGRAEIRAARGRAVERGGSERRRNEGKGELSGGRGRERSHLKSKIHKKMTKSKRKRKSK